MRMIILLASAALALGACGKETTGNTAAVDENFATEDVVTNDATVIDAAMSADANMAADVELNIAEFGNEGESASPRNGSDSAARPRIVRPAPSANTIADTPNTMEPTETDESDE